MAYQFSSLDFWQFGFASHGSCIRSIGRLQEKAAIKGKIISAGSKTKAIELNETNLNKLFNALGKRTNSNIDLDGLNAYIKQTKLNQKSKAVPVTIVPESENNLVVETIEPVNLNDCHDLFVGYCQSSNEFPIDLDQVWQWLGYSRKDPALGALKTNFVENVDFSPCKDGEIQNHGNIDKYYLTVDCFKSLCMMARTQRGKDVRNYFIQCEKELKKGVSNTSIDIRSISRIDLARLIIESESEKKVLVEQNTVLSHQLQEAQPAIEYQNKFIEHRAETISMSEFCKSAYLTGLTYQGKPIGTKTMYKIFRELGLCLKEKNEPYQKYINKGWLICEHYLPKQSQKMVSSIRVTTLGALQKNIPALVIDFIKRSETHQQVEISLSEHYEANAEKTANIF